MTAVVAFDVSTTRTGVARADGTTSSIRPGGGAADPYRRLHELGLGVVRVLDADKPDLAVIEGPDVIRGRAAMRRLCEAVGLVRYLCWLRGIRVVEVGPTELKGWATGNGHATKDEMIAVAVARGASPANDDEADAWLLREMAVAYYDDPARSDAAVARWLTGAAR